MRGSKSQVTKQFSWHRAESKGEWGPGLEAGRAEGHLGSKRQLWSQAADPTALKSLPFYTPHG